MGRLPGPLILASGSPQRRLLLKRLKIPFRIIVSRVSEKSPEKNPRRLVLDLAKRKARAVARRHPAAVVLGADTIVVCLSRIIGKPKNARHSHELLRLLNGRWHRVYTGVAVAVPGGRRIFSEAVVTKVKARRLGDGELSRLGGKHLDKAGAYAVQDTDDPFIEKIEGELDNVIGLPLKAARRVLRRACRSSQG